MVKTHQCLKSLIDSLADQPYQKIQQLFGDYQFPMYLFSFIKIQGSPGANPASIASVKIPIEATEIPPDLLISSCSQLAVADFLIRRFKQGINAFCQQNRGRDGSGSFHTIELGQKMLQRDCVLFSEKSIELRFIFSLPATGTRGGSFAAEQAWQMFSAELNTIVTHVFYYKNYDSAAKRLLQQSIDVQQNRQTIEQYMKHKGLCVFINNGARLPRESGVDDKPALGVAIKCFQSPEVCEVNIPLSADKSIEGMAIKEGITCITGGGYHGKSTLLQAILAGVYAHIPGDGRELIVTRQDATFISAEEGRSIRQVNISPFISTLPNKQTTDDFSTDNASGSISQAASIIETIESGSRLLLFDEDSSATNFLFRDELIKKILLSSNEPIKPLYSALRSLWTQHDISMIFVVGGLGSFLQKADTCLQMTHYQCFDITAKVRIQLGEIIDDNGNNLNFSVNRGLGADNFNPMYINQRLKKEIPVRIKPLRNMPRQLEYGMDLINLDALPQLVEAPQTRSLGFCLLALRQALKEQNNESHSLCYWINWLYDHLDQKGLSFLEPDYPGTLSLPRKYELAAAINRIRSLKTTVS